MEMPVTDLTMRAPPLDRAGRPLAKARRRSAYPYLATDLYLLGMAVFLAAGLYMADRTDRGGWTELNCIASHVETETRPDSRPHKQGGRGGMITTERTVCDERASIGPVMPEGWRPGR